MEVQHLSGFEATVTQNFLQIAVEEPGTKGKKEKLLFRALGPKAKDACHGAYVGIYGSSGGRLSSVTSTSRHVT